MHMIYIQVDTKVELIWRTVETTRTQVSFTINFYMQVDTPVELILQTVETTRTQVSFTIDFYMQVAHQPSEEASSR